MKEKIKRLRSFDFKLFAALCAASLVPAIYQTIKTAVVSVTAQNGAFDVIGQMEWFDLINETLHAFLIVPLYSVLNRILKSSPEDFPSATFKTGIVAFVLYALFSVGVLVYGESLVRAMNPAEYDASAAGAYLRIETAAFMIGIIVDYVTVTFVVTGKPKNVYIMLGVKTAISVVSDFLLIPRLGVNGVAVSNVVANTVISAAGVFILIRQRLLKPAKFAKSDLDVAKTWIRIGVFSGLQQFIDNLIYAIMICKMVNSVAAQGDYWIANNFIWGWLLIPVSALSEVVRRDCKDGYKNLILSNYYLIAAFSVILWAVTVPLWQTFFSSVERLDRAREIFILTLKLAPFYVAYAGCAITDGIFVGLGKTAYCAVNSLIINFGYYGIFFVLYETGALVFTLDAIVLMFGFGMVAHLIISLLQEKVFLRKSLRVGERTETLPD